MAMRDAVKWMQEIARLDRAPRLFDPDDVKEVNWDHLVTIIREAQEDGAAEWKTRSETLTDDNMAMAAEIAELHRERDEVRQAAAYFAIAHGGTGSDGWTIDGAKALVDKTNKEIEAISKKVDRLR